LDKSKKPLFKLAQSTSLRERRIAIVLTRHFIRYEEFDETLEISRMHLEDNEDLIHNKAGWMLREVGKNDQSVLEGFLEQYGTVMPRTMLRYAIEQFTSDLRRAYLRRKITPTEGETH
jgi:3-methyladenine DNA glycosylase AlkD